jgi:hypothetical protein
METSFLPADPLLPLLESWCTAKSSEGKVYLKVKGVLRDYAEHIGTTPQRLRIMDVYDGSGQLHPKILNYINRLSAKRNKSIDRLERYRREIRSRLRYLYKILCQAVTSDNKKVLLNEVPEQMWPILPYLRRVGGNGIGSKEQRLQLPLSDLGLVELTVFLKVWRKFKLSTLKELLVDYAPALYSELRKTAPAKMLGRLISDIPVLRKKASLKSEKRKRQSLPEKLWPQTLSQEWKVFEHVAKNGIGANRELARAKRRYKVSVGKLSIETVNGYREAMCYALGVIRPSGDLSILDLITLIERKVECEDDEDLKWYNPLVDLFRAFEQAKQGPVKPQENDSDKFYIFRAAVNSIAACNGHARLVKRFNRAYSMMLAKEEREQRKDKKKRGLTLAWVDNQIAQLNLQFLQIIKKGSFKGKNNPLAHHNLCLIMFFVWFVTLRYMGYRQQSLVKCVVGENFILRDDGSILLQFDTKNGKRIKMDLNSGSPNHALLWSVLTLYYKKVYPYLVKESGNTLNGRLFVMKSRPFKHHTHFYLTFVRYRNKFMATALDELPPEMRYQLHPHFLRGLCADWMIIVLGMSFEEAADVLGDEPETLKLAYVDKKRVRDAGAIFEAVNRRRQLMRAEFVASGRIESRLDKIEMSVQKAMAEKDQKIVFLQSQNDEAMAKIAELTAKLARQPGATPDNAV